MDAFAPVFYSDFIHSPFPAATLLHLLEKARPDEFADVPLDGTKTGLETGIAWEAGQLQVATSAGQKDVAATKFLVVVHYESRVCELESGSHHVYADAEGNAVQRSAFEAEMFGGVAKFEFQSTDEGEPAASWSFKPKGAKPEHPPSVGPRPPEWVLKLSPDKDGRTE